MSLLLVDLDTAKAHLRMDVDVSDHMITSKIIQASAIIRDYLKVDEDAWDQDPLNTEALPLPFVVQAATLLCVEALFDGSDPLSDTIKNLVHRYRDPAMAWTHPISENALRLSERLPHRTEVVVRP